MCKQWIFVLKAPPVGKVHKHTYCAVVFIDHLVIAKVLIISPLVGKSHLVLHQHGHEAVERVYFRRLGSLGVSPAIPGRRGKRFPIIRLFRCYVLDMLRAVGCPHLGDEESFPELAFFPSPVSLAFSSTADTAVRPPMSTSLASQTVVPSINTPPVGMTPSPRQVVTARGSHV